jgi:hypothetical protein
MLSAEQQRPLDPDAATAWLDQYQWAIETSEQLPTIDACAIPLYLALLEDADRIATMATLDPADPHRRQHAHAQRRAATILHRHHPSLAVTTITSPPAGRAFPPTTKAPPAAPAEQAPAPPRDITTHRRRAR